MNFRLSANRKEIIVYGISLALVLLILKWAETHFIFYNYRLELFIGVIAMIFTALGIWLALKLAKPKIETRIVEKEVFIGSSRPADADPKQTEALGISKRELEVLNLMAAGLSNSEIADKLFVSLNTVKTHASNIFLKLDVKRRTQAIEKAKRLKLIE